MKKLLFLILIGLFLFSCKPDKSCSREDEITYENIPDSNISQIPYKGDELLSFVNQTGDTAVFKCTGYNNYYDTEKKAEGSNGCTYWVITKTQQIDFTFIDTANENRNFRVKYEAPIVISSPILILDLFVPSSNYVVGRGYGYFYNPVNFDSLRIGNGSYVYGSFLDETRTSFYNTKIGIILFADQFQNRWTLLNE
ncbi:MAG: hypothetical protein L6Q78_02210 [Bacteroidia bacterium]|nr:hypothetical protein [Bacteroidia bacterium]